MAKTNGFKVPNISEKFFSKAKRQQLEKQWRTKEAAVTYLLNKGFILHTTTRFWKAPKDPLDPLELSAITYLHYNHGYGWFR